MNFNINIQDLHNKKTKLFIATPMYGGNANGMFMKSCLDLHGMLMQYGIEAKFSFVFNESLITRARNYLVDEFLRSTGKDGLPFTHLLFIDSDINFEAIDIMALLALDKDVIGAPYPKKSINWPNVYKTVKNLLNNDKFDESKFNPGDLESVIGDFVFNLVPGENKFSVQEPIKVLEIGTGYMMIKRHVFDKFKEEYPHLNYKPDHKGQPNFDGSRYVHAYFDTVIDPDTHRYLSEDYMFCQYWRAIGGEVWLCPWMKTQHVGTYAFKGDLPTIAATTASL